MGLQIRTALYPFILRWLNRPSVKTTNESRSTSLVADVDFINGLFHSAFFATMLHSLTWRMAKKS